LLASYANADGIIDNYNAILDGAAADLVNTGSHTTPDGTVAPSFKNTVRPNNLLSTFKGKPRRAIES
jgi:hypothetical protein